MPRYERDAEGAHQRLDELDKQVAVNKAAIDDVKDDVKPLATIPMMLAEIKAMLNGVVKEQARLQGEVDKNRSSTTGIIERFVFPLIMLILGYLISSGHLP